MKTYRKNSRRNPWRNTRNNRTIPVERLIAAVLVISIPLMCICIASNMVMRFPDAYQYNLRATQSLVKTGRVVKEEKVVNLFEDFMKGKTDKFELLEDVSYMPENIFSKEDQQAMTNLRRAMNVVLALGVFATALNVVGAFFLVRWRKKETQIKTMKLSWIAFIIFTILNSLVKLVPYLRNITWGRVFGTDFPKRDVLVALLGDSFPVHVTVFDFIISLIFMGIISYVVWQVAGRKNLFKKF